MTNIACVIFVVTVCTLCVTNALQQIRLVSSSTMKLSFQGTPKRFTVAKGNLGKVAASSAQFLIRLGSGAFVSGYRPKVVDDVPNTYAIFRGFGKKIQETGASSVIKPELPIVLYEFEGCPYCRKVREAAVILDIDVLFKPCPKGGPNFRLEAIKTGGKKMFPFMVDPNNKVKACSLRTSLHIV